MAGRSPNSHVSIVHSDSGAVIPVPPGLPTDHISSFHMASDVEGPESSPTSRTSVAPGLDLPEPLQHVVSDVEEKFPTENFRVNREMRNEISVYESILSNFWAKIASKCRENCVKI